MNLTIRRLFPLSHILSYTSAYQSRRTRPMFTRCCYDINTPKVRRRVHRMIDECVPSDGWHRRSDGLTIICATLTDDKKTGRGQCRAGQLRTSFVQWSYVYSIETSGVARGVSPKQRWKIFYSFSDCSMTAQQKWPIALMWCCTDIRLHRRQ